MSASKPHSVQPIGEYVDDFCTVTVWRGRLEVEDDLDNYCVVEGDRVVVEFYDRTDTSFFSEIKIPADLISLLQEASGG